MRIRERGLILGLVLAGGSLSAAFAHLGADALAAARLGGGLASYPHASIVPAFVAALAGLCTYVLWVATRGRGFLHRRRLLTAAARRALRCRTVTLWLWTIGSGLGVLAAAESAEQIGSIGRILPGDLLGGSLPLMAGVLVAVALVASLTTRAILSALCGCVAEICRFLSDSAARPAGAAADRILLEFAGDVRRRIEMLGLTRRGPPRTQAV